MHDVRRALSTFSPVNGRGIDETGPSDYQQLSDLAIVHLINVWTDAESCGHWPAPLQLNRIVLKGKPKGKDRTLGLLQFPLRLWRRVRQPLIAQWRREEAAFGVYCNRGE